MNSKLRKVKFTRNMIQIKLRRFDTKVNGKKSGERETMMSPVNSQHKGQWRRALMFSLIYAQINGWANNREVGDLRRHRVHYDVIVMVRIQKTPSRSYFLEALWNTMLIKSIKTTSM